MHTIQGCDLTQSCRCLQGLLKKHVAFETDFQVHLDRFDVIKGDGDKLTEEVSQHIYTRRLTVYLSPCAVETSPTPGDIRGTISPSCSLSGVPSHDVYR